MNSENSKTSGPRRVLLNLSNEIILFSDKINLKRNDKYVALSNLSTYYTLKKYKKIERKQ